jgi:hypothetical protein
MSVEIRELVIRAVIKTENNRYQDAEPAPYKNQDQQAIVEACINQVLKILKRKQER